MATYTPNLNLGKPEATDAFGNFRQLFNDNMDILDNGGGGGSGGHTIIDQSGNAMPQETGLQFIGASVTDDSVNNKTVVTITGGGGGIHYSTTEQVIGTYFGKPLYQKSYSLTGGIAIGSYGHISMPSDSIIRRLEGYAYRSNHAVVDKFNGYIANGELFASIRNGDIEYWISNIFNPVEEIEFTVCYTKTTD